MNKSIFFVALCAIANIAIVHDTYTLDVELFDYPDDVVLNGISFGDLYEPEFSNFFPNLQEMHQNIWMQNMALWNYLKSIKFKQFKIAVLKKKIAEYLLEVQQELQLRSMLSDTE